MFEISELNIFETYGGVYGIPRNIEVLNLQLIKEVDNRINMCFGSDRKVWKETVDVKRNLPKYTFVAWLESLETVSEERHNYDGYHLFVVGFEERMEQVIQKVRSLGLEHFDKEAEGYSL